VTQSPRTSRSERVYRALLLLYPRDFRRRFGDDMCEVFRDRLHHDGDSIARVWLRTAADVVASVAREHLRSLRIALFSPPPETPRATPGDSMLSTIAKDARHALRMLANAPTFTAVAVLIIAIGSGAVTTIFSAANALILRPLPGVVEPHELVDIGRTSESGQGSLSPSYPYYANLRDDNRTFDGIAAWTIVPLTVSSGAEGMTATGNLVSGNYFDVLGARPALGRFFSAEENRTPGTHPVVVLSHGFWQRRFGGDSAIVGRDVGVNGQRFSVVGVAPPEFGGVTPVMRVDAWLPMMMAEQLGQGAGILANRGSGWLVLFGRLKEGVSPAQAQADLSGVASAHASEDPGDMRGYTGIAISRVTGFPSFMSGVITRFVSILLAVAAIVLVIASVNVAGMLLVRATARRREMAVRTALGASRGRLVRQLLTESVVLFVAGAGGGALLAIAATRMIGRVSLDVDVPLSADFTPDYRVLAFTLGVALLTGIVFGLAPALQATRADQNASLRNDTPGGGRQRSRLRDTLVVGQMAVSLILLVAAGLFVRALERAQDVQPGFETRGVAAANIDVGTAGYDEARARAFHDELRSRLTNTPGVSAVAYARHLPLTGSSSGTNFSVEGYVGPEASGGDNGVNVNFAVVSDGYFDVIRLPLVAGRGFAATDGPGTPQVAVVNETFARRFWPDGTAIGKVLRSGSTPVTIVGVARDAKYTSLGEEQRSFVYLPLAQNWTSRVHLMVRGDGDASSLAPAIRQAVLAGDRLLPSPEVTSLQSAASVTLLPQRIAAGVTGAMGALGLLLTAVGLYGVVAYSAGQRTREIGVRMALGADRGRVLRLILGGGMRLVVTGIGLGVVLALAATRVLQGFLFGVSPLDPLVFTVIPLGLAAVALLASFLPARRAAAANPLTALRGD
jgi:predicted permease